MLVRSAVGSNGGSNAGPAGVGRLVVRLGRSVKLPSLGGASTEIGKKAEGHDHDGGDVLGIPVGGRAAYESDERGSGGDRGGDAETASEGTPSHKGHPLSIPCDRARSRCR